MASDEQLTATDNKLKSSAKIISKQITSFSAADSLARLKAKMSDINSTESGVGHYQEYVAAKNSITPSIASLKEKPFLKPVEVDCNNSFNVGILVISGLFGGRIVCNRQPKLDRYIKARLVDKQPLNKQ